MSSAVSLGLPAHIDYQSVQSKSLDTAGRFKPSPEMTREQIYKKANEFEAVFISQMLAPMFDGIETEGGLFGGGHAEKMYKSMMIEEIGKEMSAAGGLGIADSVATQLIRMQEAQQ